MDADKRLCPECGSEISPSSYVCENCRREKQRPSKLVRAIRIVIGILLILTLYWILVLINAGGQNLACQDNLKQLSQALQIYAEDNHGEYPPIDATKNVFIFNTGSMYPWYLSDLSLLNCPSSAVHPPMHTESFGNEAKALLTDDSYMYFGWMIMNDEDAIEFFKAYDRLDPEGCQKNIPMPKGRGNIWTSELLRLSVGVDRFLITDLNVCGSGEVLSSLVPIIWDRPSTNPKSSDHRYNFERGGNVLYLDGHVEFKKYGEFPMTEKFARLLEERKRERPLNETAHNR